MHFILAYLALALAIAYVGHAAPVNTTSLDFPNSTLKPRITRTVIVQLEFRVPSNGDALNPPRYEHKLKPDKVHQGVERALERHQALYTDYPFHEEPAQYLVMNEFRDHPDSLYFTVHLEHPCGNTPCNSTWRVPFYEKVEPVLLNEGT
ncbi:hypothetical protein F5879DRAFT_349813 [Lentinula edodes]|uniref:Uncharacterized protein n=1 Tax=Lentinula edodes TaxID=5353 RepID=A0A1Q3E2L2_LENED|nr:uncharacterized protein C8R40DRAFT_424610 [Lentinula edodes]KAH7872842.1 hypothetical protein C8R40DRAFT_424610 [Lentinula edodes]KAJ3901159.1 hypothetical protein F5879DRAFT_349813 [Lentinula edodes]KAJ3916158.1 hypothetical protein F5877DRAFT_81167 [Lentinula edodes]GAW01498.1 hypothetical protein LENED_003098 [Lentinula edodes]